MAITSTQNWHAYIYTAYITSEETPSNRRADIAAIIVAAALAITVIIKRRKGIHLNNATRLK